MLALHSLSLSKSLMSSHAFSEMITSVTTVHVNPHDFALASMAQLSLVRYHLSIPLILLSHVC